MAYTLMSEDCLDLLRNLHPVRGLIHVGDTEKQTLSRYSEWAPGHAFFVIGDECQHRELSHFIDSHPGWTGAHAIVAESTKELDYFVASNPRESGLLAPESLAGIWRNIKTLSRKRVHATTLDSLVQRLPGETSPANWMIVNCLPALSVLQGATSCINECDVIIARSILDESISADPCTALSLLDNFVVGQGFRRLFVREEPHPALGYLVYVRDWQKLLVEYKDVLQAGRAEYLRVCNQHSSDADEAIRNYGDLNQLNKELERQIEQLTSERERIETELAVQMQLKAAGEACIVEITAERDKQFGLANKRSCELEQAIRGNDDLARTAEEHQRQIEQLTLERDRIQILSVAQSEMTAEREAAIAHITADRDKQLRIASQLEMEREHAVHDLVTHTRLVQELQLQVEAFMSAGDQGARKLLEVTEKSAALAAELLEVQAKVGDLNSALRERDARVVELEAERVDIHTRQLRLDREIFKAEAQIDLIKDVILREKAF